MQQQVNVYKRTEERVVTAADEEELEDDVPTIPVEDILDELETELAQMDVEDTDEWHDAVDSTEAMDG